MSISIIKILIVIAFITIIFNMKADAQDAFGVSEKGTNNLSIRLRFARSGCTNNGCRCYPGSPQGQYCLGDNVYECNPGGGCCIYGYRKSCAQCGKLKC